MAIGSGLLALQGLAEGLKSGFNTYRDERDRQEKLKQQALQNQQGNQYLEIAMRKAGLEYNPGNAIANSGGTEVTPGQGLLSQQTPSTDLNPNQPGLVASNTPRIPQGNESAPTAGGSMGYFKETPLVQLQKQSEEAEARHQLALSRPDSPESQAKREYYRSVLKQVKPGLERMIPDNVSGVELESKTGLIPEIVKGAYGAQGREATAKRIGERTQAMRENLDERKNVNASHAGQAFENDKLLKQMKNTQYNLSRAEGMLNGTVPLNVKNFALLQQDLINATAPGGAATEGKVNREMVDTWAGSLNNLITKTGTITDVRKMQPEIVNQLKGLISEIKNEYLSGMSSQAADIHDSFQFNTNPKVKQTIKDKLKRYAPQEYAKRYGEERAPGADNSHPKDGLAIQWARQNPNDPMAADILNANGVK